MLSREKNKVIVLHFIMSVLVILIHSINNSTKLQKFFSIESGVGQFAVPLFFMLSGFLFFQNVINISEVPKKINKRVYTLLYPFMIWNFIYYIIHHIINPGLVFSFTELFDAILAYTYNPAFWFMFQLILLVAITPIIYYAINKVSYFVVFFVIISLFIIIGFDIPFINEDAIIYFASGAFFSKLYKESKVYFIEKKNILFALLISIFCFLLNRIANAYVNKSLSFVGIFTLSIVYARLSVSFLMFYLADLFFAYRKTHSFMGNTFFLYGIHYMIVKALIIFMNYVKYKFLEPEMWMAVETAVFLLSPVICVVISHYLSRFLSKKFTKVYNIMVGYRK